MNLKGSHELKAAPQQVWEALNRPDLLRQCTPGCKKLEAAEDGSFDVLLEVGVGSVKGRYAGKIRITDRIPGSQYKLAISGTGSVGFLNAEGLVQLHDAAGQTRIEYSGSAQVGGPIAGVGQRMMEGIAKLLVGQFFHCLEKTMLAGAAAPSGPGQQPGNVA